MALDAILDRAGVPARGELRRPCTPTATTSTSRCRSRPVREQGIVVYRLGDGRLGVEHGGPIRFLIRDPSVCHTGELDECANVKYLSRIELTDARGRDTRPATEADHAALHRSQAEPPCNQSDGIPVAIDIKRLRSRGFSVKNRR